MTIDDVIFDIVSNMAEHYHNDISFQNFQKASDPTNHSLGTVIHTYEVDGVVYEVFDKKK